MRDAPVVRPTGVARKRANLARRAGILALAVAAPFGLALGVGGLVQHVGTDPLVDVRAYYDAGARLNAGLPLYDPAATSATGLYLYPPLLAILFRPLALLPFEVAAGIWVVCMLAAFAATLARIGLTPIVLLSVAVLAMPIAWALAIGQVEPLLTLLLAVGSPFTVAVAGNLKLVPLLVAVYWVARRDGRSLASLAAWMVGLGIVQLALAPQATLDYLSLEWVGAAFEVRNLSPFAVHPLLWVALVAILAFMAWRRAGSASGWAWAVALAVLAYPRLLAYQLMTLLAAYGGRSQPGTPDDSGIRGRGWRR